MGAGAMVVAFWLLQDPAGASASDAELSGWAREACPRLERLLLDPSAAAQRAMGDSGPAVAVMLLGEWEPGLLMTLSRSGKRVTCDVTMVTGSFVCDQASALKRRSPGLSDEELARNVSTKHLTMSSSEEPKLAALYSELGELRARPWAESSTYFPGIQVEMRIQSQDDYSAFRFSAPDPSADAAAYSGSPAPLQQELWSWIGRLRHLVHADRPPEGPAAKK